MEILRDSIWQFIGIIIAVIVAFWIYRLQKNRKSLSYLILASNELLTASEEIRGRVEVLFDKRPVQNVHLLVLRFTNNGNVPILETDFYEPIRIDLGEETQILSAEIIERSPDSFRPELMTEVVPLGIFPTLINSGDSFAVKLLLAQYSGKELKIDGRIVGVKAVTADLGNKKWQRISVVSKVVMTISALIGVTRIPVGSEIDFWLILFFTATIANVVADVMTLPSHKPKKT